MSNISKFVAALVALLVMAIIASQQLFLSVVTRDSAGLSTAVARSHLWLALGAGISAGIAFILMFRFFVDHEKHKWSNFELTPTQPVLAALGGNRFIHLAAPAAFEGESSALASRWLPEGQSDDRLPMDGSVRNSGETTSGQRSFARRTHQLRFKKWSQERHE